MTFTKQEAEVVAKRAYLDPVFFCHTFLGHWFQGEISWLHRGLLAILLRKTDFLLKYGELDKIVTNFTYKEDPSDPDSREKSLFEVVYNAEGEPVKINLLIGQYTLAMIPRSYSKTTTTNAAVLFSILFLEKEFIVYISETDTHASMQLGNIKRELEANPAILAVFGKLQPEYRSGRPWNADLIETMTGCVVVSRGRGGQIRGLNHNGRRPDWEVWDDLEDKESVSTSDQRNKSLEWAYGDAIPALAAMGKEGTITALGTLLNADALLMTLARDPLWTTCKFGAIDKQGDPLWAARMGHKELEKLKASFALAGKLNVFYMEYHNEVRSEESQKFRKSFIRYGLAKEDLHKALALDPAISDKPGADFCALVVAGMEMKTGQIHVLDVWGKVGASPRDQIDRFFDFHKLYDPQYCGVEAISFQAALIHLLREEMFRKKRYFEITPITHKTKKEERVEGILQPRYANGYVIHARPFPLLEGQLLDWPNGKKDFPDALAMAVALLDPMAAAAAGEKDLGEDEYDDLDKVFKYEDWRAEV
jgi:hypothetical protein